MHKELKEQIAFEKQAMLKVKTLGSFEVIQNGEHIPAKAWGRDKTIQLFQFFISNRNRKALHKEQIIDRLWEDANDRDFKVALHGINKALEPDRAARTEPTYLIRQGQSYCLNLQTMWIDAEAIEQYIITGNNYFSTNENLSIEAYRLAIDLYQGNYLPNRVYEDWSSEERERIQVLALGAFVNLAELLLDKQPMESIRLTQAALAIDPCWENAYRIQMQAHLNNGNRPLAIKTYQNCTHILDREYGISPLPATKNLMESIAAI